MPNIEALKELFLSSSKNEDINKKLYKDFSLLDQARLGELIDLIISETDDVTAINNLIRIRESVSVIFDHKLLFASIINIVASSY